MTAVAFDLDKVQDACNAAEMAARTAAKQTLAALGGDRGACGFAWVNVYGVRSNSRLGKTLQTYGFSKSYTGGLSLWNPSKAATQSISILEAGADAAYRVDFAGEIDEAWLEGATTVGLTSGASVPEILVNSVLAWLAERGYTDVEEVETIEEHLIFALPPELRRDIKAAGRA